MEKFVIEEPCTLEFKTNCASLTISFNSGQLYHVQAPAFPITKVKFPIGGEFTANCQIVGATPGIKKPKEILKPEQDRFYNSRLFHVVYNADLKDSPARIFYDTGRCEIGPSFKNYPYQYQKFILEHEKGHCFYSDEFNCDIFALNEFLQKGFNLSQAYGALKYVLQKSPQNIQRIEKIYNQIEKISK
jgi:hypothetical protein